MQTSTPAVWRIATPVEAGAIHPISFVRVFPVHAPRSESRFVRDQPFVDHAVKAFSEPKAGLTQFQFVITTLSYC